MAFFLKIIIVNVSKSLNKFSLNNKVRLLISLFFKQQIQKFQGKQNKQRKMLKWITSTFWKNIVKILEMASKDLYSWLAWLCDEWLWERALSADWLYEGKSIWWWEYSLRIRREQDQTILIKIKNIPFRVCFFV